MKNKKVDFLITVLLLAIGAIVSFYYNFSNPVVEFLYLGVPSLFLMIREKKNYKKIGWGVLIFGVLMGGFFDFIAKINNAWIFTKPLFPQLLIGDWLVENLFAYIFMALFVIVFYEHFLDDENDRRLSKSHSKVFLFLLVVTALVYALFLIAPDRLEFSYFYLKAGFAAIIFPIIFAFYNPQIIKKFAPLAFFFFFVWVAAEFVGLSNGNWIFPATNQYVGSVNLLGVTFPFEEVFFWFMWYPAVIVAYYEYFIDDRG